MENLIYREVQIKDLDKICRLPQTPEELFFMFPKATYPLTFEQLHQAIERRYNSTVILLHDEIVAFANFYDININEYCSIGNVIVSQKFRNRGIGHFLIKIMESIAVQEYNIQYIHLSCFNTNTNGILFYSKLGYNSLRIEEREYNGERIALIKMIKKL